MRYTEFVFNKLFKDSIIADNARSINYEMLLLEVNILKKRLVTLGIKKKDTIAVMFDNRIEFIISLLATNMLDAYAIPLYYMMGREKLKYALSEYGVKCILTNKKEVDGVETSLYQKHMVSTEIYAFVSPEEVLGDFDVKDKDTLMLLTSGTTGKSKCVVLTNKNIISSIRNISQFMKISHQERILVIKNVVHISTLVGEILVGLYCGCSVFLSNRLIVGNHIDDTICKKKITVLSVTPTILQNIFPKLKEGLQQLKVVHISGELLPFSIVSEICKKAPHIRVCVGYGLTEASPRITQIDTMGLLERPGTVGKTIGDQILKIIDEKNNFCPPLVVGEIIVKGSNIMKGYLHNKELVKPLRGWLYTGDLGYLDENGFLYVQGRKDNMFIINGRNIQPEEIENVLKKYLGIKEVLAREYILGNKHSVEALIVTDLELNVSDISRHCKRFLEDYKIPTKITFVDNISKTVTGKLNRCRIGVKEDE